MESIETLNQRLRDTFGLDTNTNQPIFRIVWSDGQLEKRMVDYVDKVQLPYPQVREVPKYPYVKHLYILEQLVIIPDENLAELPMTKLSYEPLWVYRDDSGGAIPPVWNATKFIIDTLYAAKGKESLAKYVDSEKNTTIEGRSRRIDELQLELFGNETETGDALRYKQGIVVPSTYKEN